MKKEEWNEGLNNIDSDLVEKYVEEKDKLTELIFFSLRFIFINLLYIFS